MAAKTLFDGGVSAKLFLDQRQFYPNPNQVAEMWADLTPFKTFLMKLRTETVDDVLYKMFENESSFVKRECTTTTATTIAADGTASAALTVANIVGLPSSVTAAWEGCVFEIWDSTKTTKRGAAVVYDAASTSTVTMKTLKGTAITTVSGDYLIYQFRIRGEGSIAPAGESKQLSVVWNSSAFLSDSCELTKDLAQAKLRGYSNDMAFQREEMFKRYSSAMEQSLLTSVSTVGTNMDGSGTFSEASLRTVQDPNTDTGSARTTYGYIPILEDYGITYNGTGAVNGDTNIFKLSSASLSYGDFIKYDEVVFDKRTTQQTMDFLGRGAMTKLAQKIVDSSAEWNWKGQVSISTPQRLALGFNAVELNTVHGQHNLVQTRSLRNQYNNYWCIPDYENIGVAQYEADFYGNNVKVDDDYEGIKDVIKSKKGLWMTLLKKHHLYILQ